MNFFSFSRRRGIVGVVGLVDPPLLFGGREKIPFLAEAGEEDPDVGSLRIFVVEPVLDEGKHAGQCPGFLFLGFALLRNGPSVVVEIGVEPEEGFNTF